MPSCAVNKCHSNNRIKHGIQFHRFPKDHGNCEKWVKFCDSHKPINLNNATICSLHFKKDDYTLKPVLKDGVLPSVNMQCLCGKCQRKRCYKIDLESCDSSSSSDNEVKTSESYTNLKQINVDVNTQKYVTLAANKLHSIKVEEEIQKRLTLEKKLKLEIQKVSALKIKLIEERKKKLALEVKLNYEKQRQKASDLRAKAASEAMNKIFTPLQIQVLKTGQHPHRWDHQSIIKGLGLRATTSKKVYEYLRTTEHLPLPSFITLTHWVQDTFAITPGEISQTLNLLKLKLPHMSSIEKNVVLIFDEMSLNPVLCYDRFEDKIYGPCHSLQIVIVRSITSNWTQPIIFNFDRVIDKNTVLSIIKELESIGLKVRGIVSDLSQKNFDLWNELNISSDTNTGFENIADPSRKVWMFADSTFLLLSLRDHILDYGMSLNGRIALHHTYFSTLMQFVEDSQYKICNKLTWSHLQVRGPIREQAWLAAQLLSNTVATTMKTHIPEISEGAHFIELVDKIFDVMNSSKKSSDKVERCGFGVNYKTQIQGLNEFENLISQVRFGDQNNLLSFQEGYIVSARSLIGLYEDLLKEGQNEFEYLLTSRLSLDCVHDVFNKLKLKTKPDAIPNAVEAKAQLRLLLIGANKEASQPAAVGLDDPPSFDECVTSQVLGNIPELVEEVLKNKDPDSDLLLPEIVTDELDEKYAQLIQEVCTDQTIEKVDDTYDRFKTDLSYVYAEEIIDASCSTMEVSLDQTNEGNPKKKKKVVPKCKELHWVQSLSRGGLKVSAKWFGKFKMFEDDFNSLHNTSLDNLSRNAGITTELIRILNTKWPKLDNRILKRYARLRTQIRLRHVLKTYQQNWVPVVEQ